MQSFVACPAAGGAAVYVDGLHEYEILHDGSPRIAITLLRCVGDLSRDDLATRPHGHAGPGLATPGAQCLGVYEFAVAFEPLPHAPAMADLYASARALTTPPRMAVADAPGGGLPPRMEMLGLDSGGGDVILSALKKTDARESLTVRAFNAGPNDTSVILSLPAGIAEAADLNLLEEPQAALALEGEATRLAFSGFALKTVELRPARRPLPPGR